MIILNLSGLSPLSIITHDLEGHPAMLGILLGVVEASKEYTLVPSQRFGDVFDDNVTLKTRYKIVATQGGG